MPVPQRCWEFRHAFREFHCPTETKTIAGRGLDDDTRPAKLIQGRSEPVEKSFQRLHFLDHPHESEMQLIG
jgi:hypothetical protein